MCCLGKICFCFCRWEVPLFIVTFWTGIRHIKTLKSLSSLREVWHISGSGYQCVACPAEPTFKMTHQQEGSLKLRVLISIVIYIFLTSLCCRGAVLLTELLSAIDTLDSLWSFLFEQVLVLRTQTLFKSNKSQIPRSLFGSKVPKKESLFCQPSVANMVSFNSCI